MRSLRLWEAPEFQTNGISQRLDIGNLWRRVSERYGAAYGGVRVARKTAPASSPSRVPRPSDANPPTQAQIDATVGAYAGYLAASNDGHSMTILVSYRALTPERAATIVNAHIDSYRNLEVKAKVAAAERANSALTAQVAELRQQLQAAEAAVTRYREEHHLTGAAKDSAGVSAQLAGLNSQLMAVRAEIAENEARAASIGAGAGSDSLPEVVTSGTVAGIAWAGGAADGARGRPQQVSWRRISGAPTRSRLPAKCAQTKSRARSDEIAPPHSRRSSERVRGSGPFSRALRS